jgi:4-hydroxy-3-methylbut-2-enyl diphosphate reductase
MSYTQARRGLDFKADDSVEITVATNAGACFGVVRAIKLGYQAVQRAKESGAPIYSFGPLIHNPHVVEELARQGVRTIAGSHEVESGTVVLRSHGIQKTLEADLRSRGVAIVDATCPLVKKPQRIAQSLGEKGYFLVIVGDANHPEVKGVLSYFGRDESLVTYDPEDISRIPEGVEKVGVIAQTTIEVRVLNAVVERLKMRFADVVVYNTICDATSVRQNEAVKLAQSADVLVVVGGKNSSNTSKLVKICQGFQKDTYHIEDLQEIRSDWFRHKRKIGVTAGASTPHEYVNEVGEHIAGLIDAERRAEG